jgi:hypothetical protein
MRLHALAPDPATTQVVVRIYRMFLDGCGYLAIAERLTAQQIPPPSGHDQVRNPHRLGLAWSKSAVRAILQNPRYTGSQVWNRQRRDEVLLDDDDTIYLAYYFFDDTLANGRRDRVAWLLHDAWELPTSSRPGEPFQAGVPVRPLLPGTDGAGATYVVLPVDDDVLWHERRRPWVLPGVRLPQLAAWLRAVTPAVTEIKGQRYSPLTGTGDLHPHRFEGWPEPLLLLRALVAPAEQRLAAALERCNQWPEYFSLEDDYARAELGWAVQGHGQAHARALQRLRRGGPLWWQGQGRDPSASRIRESEHLVQMAMHVTECLGYRSWVLFDDLWASAHPDLARACCGRPAAGGPFAP